MAAVLSPSASAASAREAARRWGASKKTSVSARSRRRSKKARRGPLPGGREAEKQVRNAGQPGDRERGDGRGRPGHDPDLVSGFRRGGDQTPSRVGHAGRAGVGDVRDVLAAGEAVEELADARRFVVLVARQPRGVEPETRRELARDARVLAEDRRNAAQRGNGAGRQILEISDRGGDDVELSRVRHAPRIDKIGRWGKWGAGRRWRPPPCFLRRRARPGRRFSTGSRRRWTAERSPNRRCARTVLTAGLARSASETETQFRDRVLSAMIDDYLRYRDALRFAPSSPDAAAVDEALRKLRQRLQSEGKDPDREFREAGMTIEEVRASIEKQMVVSQYVRERFSALAFISPEDLQAEYDGPFSAEYRRAGRPVPPSRRWRRTSARSFGRAARRTRSTSGRRI